MDLNNSIKFRNLNPTTSTNQKNDFNFEKDLENSMREENDGLVDQVYTSVKKIKAHAQEMKGKIQMSNQKCNEMDKKYTESNSLMAKTMRQLDDVLSANSNYWCYLIIFIILVVFFLYQITH